MARIFLISREELHKELCRGFFHYINHSYGSSLFSQLIDKLPKGVHRKKSLLWIETFTSLRLIQSDPAKFERDKLFPDDYESACKSPYWTMELPKNKPTSAIDGIKSSLLAGIHDFISDPSDTNYEAVIKNMNAFKQFGNSSAKKKLTITPARLLQGGSPS
jgi:hypothetical protein